MKETTEIPKQLFCQVCVGAIPEEKARRRSNTCGKSDCVNALRRYRANVLATGKCSTCYHPCSPEEWELFRKFRKWQAIQDDSTMRGFLEAPRGMTLRALTRKLIQALSAALRATEGQREGILERSTLKRDGKPDIATLPDSCRGEIEELDRHILSWSGILEDARQVIPEKTVDAKAAD